jgi:Ca2+-binding EF-hand superfamily protein
MNAIMTCVVRTSQLTRVKDSTIKCNPRPVSLQKVVHVIDTNLDGKISKRELSDLFFTSGQISPFNEPEPSASGT